MPSTRSVGDFPPELYCPLCREVMKDAVLTGKCCFRSFCDKCMCCCNIFSCDFFRISVLLDHFVLACLGYIVDHFTLAHMTFCICSILSLLPCVHFVLLIQCFWHKVSLQIVKIVCPSFNSDKLFIVYWYSNFQTLNSQVSEITSSLSRCVFAELNMFLLMICCPTTQ